jgi:hypothetical protein
LFILALPILFGFLAGTVWQNKGGNFWLLFVVGFFLPVIGLLIAFLATPGGGSSQSAIAIVKVLDKDRRPIGQGTHTGYTAAGEPIIEVPSNIYPGAAYAEDLHGPINDVMFKNGR